MFSFQLHRSERQIMHVDADAFFATVEQVLNPKLKGQPVLVGGPTEKNGIVCTASYEARKFGIHAGMPMYLAKKHCPKAIVVNGNFSAYREFSKRMYDIFIKYTPDVEMASIDEAYLDITGCEALHKKPAEEIAKDILLEIYKKLGLSVSCGLSNSKTVAKVASSTNKPHKLTVVRHGKEEEFLAPLSLRALPGVGPKTFAMLENVGLYKIGDVGSLSCSQALERLGLHGINLWKRCKGVDSLRVISEFVLPKSISKEHTFYQSPRNSQMTLQVLRSLFTNVLVKLRSYQMKAETVSIKIRYKTMQSKLQKEHSAPLRVLFSDFGFQKNLDFPSCSDRKLFREVKNLFLHNYDSTQQIRLIGVGVSKLIQDYNLSLFEMDNDEDKLLFEMDQLRKLYGQQSISYGL